MKRHSSPSKFLLMFTMHLFLILSACGASGEIQNIRVQTGVPSKIVPLDPNTINVEEISLNNCQGTDRVSRLLSMETSAAWSIQVSNKASTTAGGEVGIPDTTKLILELQIENSFQPTYEAANSRLDSFQLAAEPKSHIIYTIDWEKRVYESVVQYTINDDVVTVPFTYEIILPNDTISYAVACPDSQDNFTAPTLAIENIPTSDPKPKSLLSVTPLGNICLSGEGSCRLEMEINWNQLDTSKGNLYLVAYHPYYGNPGPQWWIAGNGISPTTSSGSGIVGDGDFGIPGDTIEIFVCQTTTDYMYKFDGQLQEFRERPICHSTSETITVQLQSP